ncbi:3-keto-disaccharide hydrolase [Labilibacter marinus]|uniref:3-keto-disaccharide hydrolase n=1 Tax=Labilibacter marinus TaxID=1477105 RepID=UPI00082EE797|nr:DUF1080 domain-containing protein [Labilibacter marinus]
MRKLQILLLLCIVLICSNCQNTTQPNTNKENWQVLFNGKDLDGWVVKLNHHEMGDNYANTFRVVDSVIQVNYDGYTEFGERFGHLYYRQPFSTYHLKFEYRFTEQWMDEAPVFAFRNSGIMFHSQSPHSILKDQRWPIALEFQFLAEETKGEPRSTGNACTPGTNIFMDGKLITKHVILSSAKTYPWNQWVSGELIVNKDNSMIHIVNGDTVLQYQKPMIGGKILTDCDSTIWIEDKEVTEGYIGLQAEGQGVEFRDIRIKDLSK